MRFVLPLFLLALQSHAHVVSTEPQMVLTSLDQAVALKGVILSKDPSLNTAVTYLSELQLNKLSALNHAQGKCAGFEVLTNDDVNQPGRVIEQLKQNDVKINSFGFLTSNDVPFNEQYQKLANLSDPQKLQETVTWIASYPNRYNKANSPNQHVMDLKAKLEDWMRDAKWPYQIDLIQHQSTKQMSLRLTIPGMKNPQEIIVLGAHFDSINSSGFGGSDKAPGADDNASGSANLIEALKILKTTDATDRTLEFYWYAGEESGLLGSAEIAKTAKAQQRNVIAVLQLDMTLFPGNGVQVVGQVTDFTSPWLRGVFASINQTYLNARLVDFQCGYGCSDHASWHRQGYHAVTPFEATMQTMNRNIHTEKDLIDSKSNFQHSNTYTKMALLFALVLGNSELKAPTF